jgi:hypothetical protein
MNVQETIKRILREGMFVPPSIKKRIDYVDEYINDMDSDDVCSNWVIDEVDRYVEIIMSDIVTNIMESSSEVIGDNYTSKYDEIYESLINLNYPEQLRDFFYESIDNCNPKHMNLQESIRRILREELNVPSYIKRRLNVADEYINNLDSEVVCRHWRDDESKEYVSESMAEITRSITDFSINISDDEYGEKFDEIYGSLIDLGYREKFKDFFYESLQNCNPKHRMRFMKP